MANITASMVSELRAKTGAGMMDCKKALTEANGDIEEAVSILRKKGLSAAAKKAGRAAAEGMVVADGNDSVGVLVEINAETDFVAKNEAFQKFCAGVANLVVEKAPADLDALMALDYPGTGRTVLEEQNHQVATIGENIGVRRFERFEAPSAVEATYIHGVGKIGVLIELTTDKKNDPKVGDAARQLAMHVAAANPQYLNRDAVPAEVVEKEKEIMRVKALNSGKPEKIIDKIIEGQINKFFGEVCLVEQAFVIDPDLQINKVLANLGKEIGGDVQLTRFVRYQLGEGLEKKQDDFAAEVAALSGN